MLPGLRGRTRRTRWHTSHVFLLFHPAPHKAGVDSSSPAFFVLSAGPNATEPSGRDPPLTSA